MGPEKFDVAGFNVAEKATHRKDGFDIFGQFLDRLFKGVDPILQVVFFPQKPVRSLGRADQLVHEKKVMGTAVGVFFVPEKFQAFLKLWQ